MLAASSQTSFVVGAIAAAGVALFVDGSSAHFLADLNLDLREALFGSSKALDFRRLDRGRGHDADREHCSWQLQCLDPLRKPVGEVLEGFHEIERIADIQTVRA